MRILALIRREMFWLSFGRALADIGHEVYHLSEVQEDLLEEAIRVFDPEVIVTIGWDIKKSTLDVLSAVISRYNLFHLYFAEEDWLHYKRRSKPYVLKTLPKFVLTRSVTCIEEYEKLGIEAAYFDVGCNPEFHRPMPCDPAFTCDVSVVANPQLKFDIFRRKSIADLVFPLFAEAYNTKIWGKDWNEIILPDGKSVPSKMIIGVLAYRYTPQVYSSSKINISLQSVEDSISNRTYDILASCGFLLTSDSLGVREKLQPGIHCEVSNSPEETLEKINFYLKHDKERERIAKAGYQYALENLAYQKTIPRIWGHIENAVSAHCRTDN